MCATFMTSRLAQVLTGSENIKAERPSFCKECFEDSELRENEGMERVLRFELLDTLRIWQAA